MRDTILMISYASVLNFFDTIVMYDGWSNIFYMVGTGFAIFEYYNKKKKKNKF